MIYDLIIIGGGPAAMSAGIYAARKKLKTLLIAKTLGGQLTEAWQIENYLGFESIPGIELSQKFISHLKKISADIEIREGEIAVHIEQIDKQDGSPTSGKTEAGLPSSKIFEIATETNKYLAKTIIICTGASPKKLNIPGEKEFAGKGVVFCATCDAPMFSGKIVAVVGSGNSGLSAALQLTKYAAKIYLINKYPNFSKGDIAYAEKVNASPLIKIINNSLVKEIKGDKFVRSIIFEHIDTKRTEEINVEGVFVEIGTAPSLHFLGNLVKYNEKGAIIVKQENNMASCPGIFAAGDVTNLPYKQIIIAAGEGAKAALGVYDYLIATKI